MKKGVEPELDTSALSALLRQAIADMDERLAANGDYTANGRWWHGRWWHDASWPVDTCHICLAGATFARFGHGPDTVELEDIPENFKPAMRALDYLRLGEITKAYEALFPDHDRDEDPSRNAPDADEKVDDLLDQYHEAHAGEMTLAEPKALADWHNRDRAFYLKMADMLEQHGL